MQEKQSPDQRMPPSSLYESEKASFLASSDIFGHLQPQTCSELERLTTVITCPPGRIFYRPGEKGTTLFLLNTGSVQLYYISPDGRKLITATLEGWCVLRRAVPLRTNTAYQLCRNSYKCTTLYFQQARHRIPGSLRSPTIALGFLAKHDPTLHPTRSATDRYNI